jgi:hypothetical protein
MNDSDTQKGKKWHRKRAPTTAAMTSSVTNEIHFSLKRRPCGGGGGEQMVELRMTFGELATLIEGKEG